MVYIVVVRSLSFEACVVLRVYSAYQVPARLEDEPTSLLLAMLIQEVVIIGIM
jgi:hypothetical protein